MTTEYNQEEEPIPVTPEPIGEPGYIKRIYNSLKNHKKKIGLGGAIAAGLVALVLGLRSCDTEPVKEEASDPAQITDITQVMELNRAGQKIFRMNGHEITYDKNGKTTRYNGHRVLYDKDGRVIELNGHRVLYGKDGKVIELNGHIIVYGKDGKVATTGGNSVLRDVDAVNGLNID